MGGSAAVHKICIDDGLKTAFSCSNNEEEIAIFQDIIEEVITGQSLDFYHP